MSVGYLNKSTDSIKPQDEHIVECLRKDLVQKQELGYLWEDDWVVFGWEGIQFPAESQYGVGSLSDKAWGVQLGAETRGRPDEAVYGEPSSE